MTDYAISTMKTILIIILMLTALRTYSQEAKYEFSELDSYESFLIRSDSFVYRHSWHLINGVVFGNIKYLNDTLILNSNIQPIYTLNKTFDSLMNNDIKAITVKNVNFPNQYGLRVHRGDNYHDINLQESSLITIDYDSIKNSSTYYITSKRLSEREKLYVILYRTNLTIAIDWKNSEINKFEIEFHDLPDVVDYEFFTNKKAVINQGSLILLDQEGKAETTHYFVKTKKKIRLSKKKKVKEYINSGYLS